ncbi:hypothetical protein ACWEOR_08105 [Micromonospora chalcea]|uniref:hypothetical protein n=1 Tax=Micromonospora chalcea TaxID=1874 RepID=UPI003455304D
MAFRAAEPSRRQVHGSRKHLQRVSGKVVADIVRLERQDNRLRPGDIGYALQRWIGIARGPARQLLDDFGGCPCGCTLDYREVLDIALRSLPGRAARELRRVIEEADDRFLGRTLANPWADPRAPWWEQRL